MEYLVETEMGVFRFRNGELLYAFCSTYKDDKIVQYIIETLREDKAPKEVWRCMFKVLQYNRPELYNIWITEYLEPYYQDTLVIKNKFIRGHLLVKYLSMIPRYTRHIDGIFAGLLQWMKILDIWRAGLYLSLMAHWLIQHNDSATIDRFIYQMDSLFYFVRAIQENDLPPHDVIR